MNKEKYYCLDERQGFDHKCVTYFDGYCSRETRCKYQLSEWMKGELERRWEEGEEQIKEKIRQKIKNGIDEFIV